MTIINHILVLRIFGCPYIMLNNIELKGLVNMDYISAPEAAKKVGNFRM
jgi:hypothetical protein